MDSTLTCPDEAELLAVATGESISQELRAHLADCSNCRVRLEQFQAEVLLLREQPAEPRLAPATASEPASDPASAGSRADQPHATAPSPNQPAETVEHPGTLPETDRGFACEVGDTGAAAGPASIGKYLVVGKFPVTGQAEVYRVVHPGLARDLVLKLAREPVGPGGQSELVEEGRILARLEHPHLVRVYDQDFLNDRPYLVMEFIPGRTLDQLAREEGLAPRRAAALVAKVAGAVAFAHRHGVVHRDIKPQNILVGESGEPRLIDFGMARLRHAWSDDPGRPGGTFAFMAPEQARIESPEEQKKVGPRSDVFALGAVLYDLLTGQAPFPGETWRESMDRARRCDFDRKALDDRKIPRGLRRICLKAMAEEPADRYPSAEALARSLTAFLRRPYQVAALALVLLIPAVAVGAWSQWPGSSRPDPRPVVIPARPAPPATLGGEMTLRVWSPGKEGKRGWKVGVDTPESLPVRQGEMIHSEAKLNQPAYVYLLWLDGQGKITPLYPWVDQDFAKLPAVIKAVSELHDPPELDKGWPVEGPSGLETILMLARRTPLPPGADLAAGIGTLPPAPLRNPQEVAVRGFDAGQPVDAIDLRLNRGPAKQAQQIDEPLLQLLEKLRPHFDVTRAVRFAHQGELPC
jgi:predicted Ser/Thr protein kinase